MAKPIRTLTEQEFNQTVSCLRMSKENIAIARKILVQGIPLNMLAKEINSKSKQTLEKAVKRIWDKFLEMQDAPRGWVSIRVCLPLEEAIQVKNKEKELKQQVMKKTLFNE